MESNIVYPPPRVSEIFLHVKQDVKIMQSWEQDVCHEMNDPMNESCGDERLEMHALTPPKIYYRAGADNTIDCLEPTIWYSSGTKVEIYTNNNISSINKLGVNILTKYACRRLLK